MQESVIERENGVEVPPWIQAPYAVLSLLAMLEFSASDWNQIIRSLEELTSIINRNMLDAVVSGNREYLTAPLSRISSSCALLGLYLSASYADELIRLIEGTPSLSEMLESSEAVKTAPLKPEDLVREFSILKKRIDDELTNRKFLAILPDRSKLYRVADLFGEQVWEAFPSARFDIEEAGTCYACGRPTASVFHLMRAMEVGLRVLGASLNKSDLDSRLNPSWERILRPCDEELQKPLSQRCAEWRSDDLFFSNATANLRAVKDAWRNPTLHVEIEYDEERALEILNAVKAFTRHLATKIHEKTN